MRIDTETALDFWCGDVDTSKVPDQGAGGRIVAWHCLDQDGAYVGQVRDHFRAADPFARLFRDGLLTGVVYHALDQDPDLPPGVYPVRIGAVTGAAVDLFLDCDVDRAGTPIAGLSYRLLGCFAKITTPLLFPDAKAYLNLDADLSIHCRRADHDRETGDEIGILFEMARRFGFIVTRHPTPTWTGEPMRPDQKTAYMERPGMHRFIPLYVCGALARHGDDDRQRRLTAAWVLEFLERPTREQPTLSAAVWRSGVVPLAAPMTVCSLGRVRLRFGLECLFVHHGKY